jgi:hypothetical protein
VYVFHPAYGSVLVVVLVEFLLLLDVEALVLVVAALICA